MPKVSIILPTYQRIHFLPRAIESVRAQTFPEWELLIVDNGSTDGTEALVQQFQERDGRIRSLKEERKGASHARNSGLQEARGEFIAFLDDDDEWLPEKLSRQIHFFESHADIELLYTQSYMKDARGILIGQKPSGKPALSFMELLEGDSIPLLTVLLRRRCLEKVGGFDATLKTAQDYDLWLRIAKEFPIGFLPEPLAIYHRHGANMSTQPLRRYQATIAIFNKLFKGGDDPSHREKIGSRLILLHYLLAREYLFRNKLSEARDQLKSMRNLMQRHDVPGEGVLFLKSLFLSMPLVGGTVAKYVLSRRAS